jgi:hypothetical protein
MNRLRMGIQSGSDKMLKFFKRPNKPGLIKNVAGVIGDYRGFMIPPAYDIIVDIRWRRRTTSRRRSGSSTRCRGRSRSPCSRCA